MRNAQVCLRPAKLLFYCSSLFLVYLRPSPESSDMNIIQFACCCIGMMFLCPWLPKRRLMLSLWFYSIKKSVGVEPLLVPHSEAFALPDIVERATQKPTPICTDTPFHRVPIRALRTQKLRKKNAYIHIPQTSTVAMLMTIP